LGFAGKPYVISCSEKLENDRKRQNTKGITATAGGFTVPKDVFCAWIFKMSLNSKMDNFKFEEPNHKPGNGNSCYIWSFETFRT
jgi:hypothetical protein